MIKEWMGQTIPHECSRLDRTRCTVHGCTLYFGHLGKCQLAPLRPVIAAPAVVYGPGEFTPWQGREGRLTIWGILRTLASSPLGAMGGLALLLLCWLAGCA